MAVANSIVTSMRGLVDAIDTLLVTTLTNNWTQDSAPTGTTTGDAAWSTGTLFIQVDWAVEDLLNIYQSLGFSAPNNPGSETGDSNLTNVADFFNVNITNAEFWGYANDTATAADRYAHFVLEFNRDGRYIHFGFGHLEKLYGVWTGGAYKYGGKWDSSNNFVQLPWSPNHRFLLDSQNSIAIQSSGNHGTIRASGLVDQAAGGSYLAFGDATIDPSGTDGDGNGIGRADGWSRVGPWHAALLMIRGNPNNAFIPFIPIDVGYRTGGSTATRRPLGKMRDTQICNIGNIQPKETITLGADDWTFFPYAPKVTEPGVGIMASRNGGVAYKVV